MYKPTLHFVALYAIQISGPTDKAHVLCSDLYIQTGHSLEAVNVKTTSRKNTTERQPEPTANQQKPSMFWSARAFCHLFFCGLIAQFTFSTLVFANERFKGFEKELKTFAVSFSGTLPKTGTPSRDQGTQSPGSYFPFCVSTKCYHAHANLLGKFPSHPRPRIYVRIFVGD